MREGIWKRTVFVEVGISALARRHYDQYRECQAWLVGKMKPSSVDRNVDVFLPVAGLPWQ